MNLHRYDHHTQIVVCRLLLDTGADPMQISNSTSSYGWTPFMCAVRNHVSKTIYRLLKDKGCSFNYVKSLYNFTDKVH